MGEIESRFKTVEFTLPSKLVEQMKKLFKIRGHSMDDEFVEAIEKDRNNLYELTLKEGRYAYRYGFHIIIHKDKTQSRWTIYENGNPIQSEQERTIFES